MADVIRELKDKATALVAKQKWPAALEAWRKVVAQAPDDTGALQKVAEMLVRLDQRDEAIGVYETVADQYAKHGLFFKASAVCRVILGLDANHQKTQERIASLFARAHAPKPSLLPTKTAAPPPPPSASKEIEIDLELELEVEPPQTASGLPSIPLFSTLTQDELKEVLSTAMEVRAFHAGDVIVREGEAGNSMFALVEGSAGIVRGLGTPGERKVASLAPGDIFGEVAIISGAPRVASVVPDGDAVALEISRDAMVNVVTRFPRVKQMLVQFYRERLLANAMRASPILRGLGEEQKRGLSAAFKPEVVPGGSVLIREGAKAGSVYLVLRGVCAASHHSGARYPDLREGDLFGEVSTLLEGNATATVTAIDTVLALKLSADEFKQRVLTDSGAMLAVKKLAQQRLARTAQLDETAPALEEADVVEDDPRV